MKGLTVDLANLEPRQRAIVVASYGGIRITGSFDAMGIGTILSPCDFRLCGEGLS
jgi:hypothetical protein